jgi:hypothetical protein
MGLPRFATLGEAVTYLAVLPTVDAVADELVCLGVRATPGVAASCVLAEYFKAVTAHELVQVLPRYGLASGSVGLVWASAPDGRVVDRAVLTPTLDEVARRFDLGELSKLDWRRQRPVLVRDLVEVLEGVRQLCSAG